MGDRVGGCVNEELLPEGYFAEEMITVGGRVEIDVATFEELPTSNGAVAVAKKTWTPPAEHDDAGRVSRCVFGAGLFQRRRPDAGRRGRVG